MKSDAKKMTAKHEKLVHTEMAKVISHVQRNLGDMYLNTVMIEGCEAPFRYKRSQPYKSLQGQRVNITYYPTTEKVGGFEMEVMKVVRIKVA